MSVFTTIKAATVGMVWKVAAIGLAAALVASSAYLGGNWWLAARDRDKEHADLVAERQANEGLRGAIREQNHAVETMATAKKLAEQRGAAARKLAAAHARRYDDILARHAGATATTCADAMPVVRDILGAIK